MTTECTESKLTFQPHAGRKVEGSFTGGRLTGKAGAVLLREREEQTKLIERFAASFEDHRQAGKVEHSVPELIAQRVYSLILGDEDLNDHDELSRDPFLAFVVGKQDLLGQNRRRERDQGKPLASRSTLSRFERGGVSLQPGEKYEKITFDESKLQSFFLQACLERYPEPPKMVVLDLDPSDVEVHGQQPEAAYNDYYGHKCYLPMYVFIDNFWPLMSQLRSPSFDPALELVAQLAPILDELRAHWPDTHFLLRADSTFSRDELMAEVEQRKEAGEKIDFVFALGRNTRLVEMGRPAQARARRLHLESDKPAQAFDELFYRTRDSWSRGRRVVARADYALGKFSIRFLVTSFAPEDVPADELYQESYSPRGQMENLIKEQQLDLFGARLSSSSFQGNQLRLYLSALAHLIVSDWRHAALRGTELARATAATVRGKLLRVAARVRISCRRIFLAFDSTYAHQSLFVTVYRRLRSLAGSPREVVVC